MQHQHHLLHMYFTLVLLAPCLLADTTSSPKPVKIIHFIINGQDLEKPEPYMASLRSISGTHECGGTLIHPKAVLTAAHCIKRGGSLNVDVGRLRRMGPDEGSRFESFKTAQVIVHDNYDPVTFDYDIALLVLDRAAAPPHYPLPLASSDYCFENQGGCTVRLLGWGETSDGGYAAEVLQQAYTKSVRRSECQSLLHSATITERMICAGEIEDGKYDSCLGDSGGPLILDGQLMGVVSFGIGCGRAQSPGVYASVPELRTWIDSKLSAIGSSAPPDPCKCSDNGISNGIQTNRFGCKQHLVSAGDFDFFCMTVGGTTCTRAQPSIPFAGAAWVLCG